MGRPERNTVDYFPHFIGNGKKIFSIEAKYGNDGYAVWFKILEKLAETDFHFLNLNDETELIYLSAKCKVEEQRLISIINDLCRLTVFDKKAWDKRIIWSQQFIESIQDVYDRRNNKCMNYEGLCKHLLSLGIHILDNNPVNVGSNTQTKLNNTKLKLKETIDVRKLAFSSTLTPFLEIYGKDVLNEFYKYWTEPNKSNTKFRQELEKTWDTERRLSTWAKNDFKNKEKNSGQKESKLSQAYKLVGYDRNQ